MDRITGALLATLLLTGIGRLAEGRIAACRDTAAGAYWLVEGWALLATAGAVSALLGLPVAVALAAAAAIGAIGLAAAAFGAEARTPFLWLLAAAVLVTPLLWFASAIPATMYDEFVQWLPNARWLVEHGAFPTAAAPNPFSDNPGYPPAVPLLIAGISRLEGGFSETGVKLVVVLMAAGFGLALATVLAPRLGCLALPVGVGAATLLNPFFDPRIALTAYADTPSGFAAGFTLLAAWRAVEGEDRPWLRRAALGAVLLVLLRETGVVLVAGVVIGLLGLAAAERRLRLARLAATVALPALAAFAVWRLYFAAAAIQPVLVFRPLAAWDWHAPAAVLRSLLLDRLAGNPMLGLAAGLVAAAGVAAAIIIARRSPPLRRLVSLMAAMTAAWLGFLMLTYVAVFTPAEVAQAASTWRYAGELGPAALLVLLVTAAGARARAGEEVRRGRMAAALLGAAALVAGEVATWRHWRIDCAYADVAAVRRMGPLLARAGVGAEGPPLAVLSGLEPAWYAVALDYDLHRPVGLSTALADPAAAPEGRLVLDLRPLGRATAAAAHRSPAVRLWRRTPAGDETVAVIPPQVLGASCGALGRD